MALRIFETDPDAKPKQRQTYSDDVVGRFHSGRMVDNTPEALSEWRVTTDDPTVGAAVAQLLGGSADEFETGADNNIEVYTEFSEVLVVIDGPKALTSDMKLWNRGQLVHHCDGVEFLSPDEDRGKVCGCPELMEERKAMAKSYRGPNPSINVVFRLADDYNLGKFRFQTGSWKLAEVLHEAEEALERIDGEALAKLTLELVEYTTKKGRDVSYYKPVIKVLKPWADAIAE